MSKRPRVSSALDGHEDGQHPRSMKQERDLGMSGEPGRMRIVECRKIMSMPDMRKEKKKETMKRPRWELSRNTREESDQEEEQEGEKKGDIRFLKHGGAAIESLPTTDVVQRAARCNRRLPFQNTGGQARPPSRSLPICILGEPPAGRAFSRRRKARRMTVPQNTSPVRGG